MQAKISIQLIALDKATKQSRDLKCVLFLLIYIHIIEVQIEQDLKENQSVCTCSTTRPLRFLSPQPPLKYKPAIINFKKETRFTATLWAGAGT